MTAKFCLLPKMVWLVLMNLRALGPQLGHLDLVCQAMQENKFTNCGPMVPTWSSAVVNSMDLASSEMERFPIGMAERGTTMKPDRTACQTDTRSP